MTKPAHVFGSHSLDKSKWDQLSDDEKMELVEIDRLIGGLAFHNNMIISSSEDGSIRSTSMNGEIKIIAEFDLPINFISLNQDKTLLLACCDDGKVYVYETVHFSRLYQLDGMDDSGVRKAVFSNNGNILVSANSGQVGIWNVENGKMKMFKKHKAAVDAIAIHPQKEIAVTNDMEGRTIVWDMEKLKVIKELTDKKGVYVAGILQYGANSVCWTDEYLILGNETIEIYDHEFKKIHQIKGLPHSPMGMTIMNGILWGGSNYLKGWELGTWKEIFSQNIKSSIYSISHDHNNMLLTGHAEGEISVWDMGSLEKKEIPMAHSGSVKFVISNDEYMITAADDKSIIVWDKTCKPVKRYFGIEREIGVCCFLSKEEIVIIDDTYAKVLNIQSMEITRQVKLGKYFTYEGSFLYGDELYISSVSNYPRILNLKTWKLSEVPFKTALYDSSQIINGQLIYCGYTSVPDEFTKKFRGKRKDDSLVEAPLVLFDLNSKTFLKEFWFAADNCFAGYEDDEEDLYAHHAIFNQDTIVAGYSTGEIAKWDIASGGFLLSEYGFEDGINRLYATTKGNYVVATPPSYEAIVLDKDLNVITGVEFETPIMVKHYSAINNQVIISNENEGEILFLDADTMEVERRESYTEYLYEVHEFNGKYFMFGNGNFSVYDIKI